MESELFVLKRLRNQADACQEIIEELRNFGTYGVRHTSPFDPDTQRSKPSSRPPGRPEAFTKLREMEDELRIINKNLAAVMEIANDWLDKMQDTSSGVVR